MQQAGIRAIPRGASARSFISRVLILVFALGFGLAARGEARTESFSPAIQAEIAQLGSKNRKKRRRAALGLAKRLEPKLLPLLLALREGSLYRWKPESGEARFVIGGDAVTRGEVEYVPLFSIHGKKPLTSADGKPLFVPDGKLNKIRAGRRIRRAVKPYLNQLQSSAQLHSADPNVRRAAATRMARVGDKNLIPLLDKALENETHWLGRHALIEAKALIRLKSPNPEERRSAAAVLGEIHGLNAVSVLQRLAEKDADASVRAAASDAIGEIEGYLSWTATIDTLFRGLSLGSILLLMALGLAIVFGLMGVINMAHGELMMLGAYATFIIQGVFIAYLPQNYFGWYFLLALPVAFLASALMGWLMEVSIIRYLYGRPLETLLTTWGISLILQQAVRQVFGAQNVDVKSPEWLSGGYHLMVGVQFPYNRMFIIALAVFCVAGTYLFLFRTRAGLRIRAVTQNRGMSTCLGVPSRRVDAGTFAFGAGLAGMAGAALSQVGNVGPALGQNYIVDSFMVVVTGGVGKILGTIVAGFGIGGMNKMLEPAMGAVFGKVVILVLVILFLQRRPEGLFAIRTRGA